MRKFSFLIILLIFSSGFAIHAQNIKHGFYILQEDEDGSIFYYDKNYSIDPVLSFSYHILDTSYSTFTEQGMPVVCLVFIKTDSTYRMLNNINKQLAWYYNDSLLSCAKIVSFDSSSSVYLSGLISAQEAYTLNEIALHAIGKKIPAVESGSRNKYIKANSITIKKALKEANPMINSFVRAVKKKDITLLQAYRLDSTVQESLIKKTAIISSRKRTLAYIEKNERKIETEFQKLLLNKNITGAGVKYEKSSVQNLQYMPDYDIYIGEIDLTFSKKGIKYTVVLDECLYFDNRWWFSFDHIIIK